MGINHIVQSKFITSTLIFETLYSKTRYDRPALPTLHTEIRKLLYVVTVRRLLTMTRSRSRWLALPKYFDPRVHMEISESIFKHSKRLSCW